MNLDDKKLDQRQGCLRDLRIVGWIIVIFIALLVVVGMFTLSSCSILDRSAVSGTTVIQKTDTINYNVRPK